MKKSKYISKYDYIAYYTKPKSFWFFTNTEVDVYLKKLKEEYEKKNGINNPYYDEDSNEEYNEGEDNDFDTLNYYQEIKDEKIENVDEQDPRIIEGLIIDQKTKEYVKSIYKNLYDLTVVDFDDDKYKFETMEKLAEITKGFVQNHKNLIMFQPVFIKDNTITKPDAFVKQDYDITIIETKGTSSCKRAHILDLYYQKQVIESQQYLIDGNYSFKYQLCLVKYEMLNKYDISFVVTDFINTQKTYSDNSIVQKSINKSYLKALAKVGHDVTSDFYDGSSVEEKTSVPIRITKLLSEDYSDVEERIDVNVGAKKIATQEFLTNIIKVFDEYNTVIKELWNHKLSLNENSIPSLIKPNSNDKSYWKNYDRFNDEKYIYGLMGYNRMKYSGNVADQTTSVLDNCTTNEDPRTFLKENKKGEGYKELFTNQLDYDVNKVNTEKLLALLKDKKVYFDFETINTAIRAIDKSYPFNQIVTQCSIIKDDGNGIDNKGCINLIIDPKKIDLEWYKIVVDNIIAVNKVIIDKESKDKVIDPINNEYSYVVYNKSFEVTRLKEIKQALNDNIYSQKIDIIINNIYDIADFFTLKPSRYNIYIEELKGYYSIKKVLPLIEKYAPDIFNQTSCLDYKGLKIPNGQICQGQTTIRFFDKMSDSDWEDFADNMKIYCENDVRAMVAVEYFVKGLYNGSIVIKK